VLILFLKKINMKYEAPNNQKFLVYNPTDSTLIEKLYYSVSCFILAVANGWEFRINDTEGVKIVDYLTSNYSWWKQDWMESKSFGRMFIKDLNSDNVKFITNYTLSDLYPKAETVMIYSNSNILKYVLSNKTYSKNINQNIDVKNLFYDVFDYLFEFEHEYYSNFEYLFDKINEVPHLGIHIKEMDTRIIYKFIKENIEKGQRVFITGDYNLIQKLKKSYNKSYLKTISKPNLDYDKRNLTHEETLIILYEIFLLKYSDSKMFEPTGKMYELFKNLHTTEKEIEITEDNKLIEIY